MRKLSDLIKENESTKKFKYNATVTVEGSVFAENEGNAGELIDKEMDTVQGMVNYEIINIEEDTTESFVNPDLSFGSEVSEDTNNNETINITMEINSYILDKISSLDLNHQLSVLNQLKDLIDENIDEINDQSL